MLWRLKEAFGRFMFGRNGFDRLTLGLLVAYLTLSITRTATYIALRNNKIDGIFWLIMTALFVYILFRILSKNIYARREEERKFLLFWSGIKNRCKVIYRNRNDKAHKYMICPHCKAIIRFPRKKGVHSANCPKCRGPLTVKI